MRLRAISLKAMRMAERDETESYAAEVIGTAEMIHDLAGCNVWLCETD